eukprot:6202406-Pleurochrysis_carterae.AAC.1
MARELYLSWLVHAPRVESSREPQWTFRSRARMVGSRLRQGYENNLRTSRHRARMVGSRLRE